MEINLLQRPRRQNQARDTTRITRPPNNRPHDTQLLRLDQNIRCAVRQPRERIPDTDAINRSTANTRNRGKKH